jgi:hypothetical protein
MLTGSSCGYPSLSAPGRIPNAEIDVVTAITAFKTIAREIGQGLESILLIQLSLIQPVRPPLMTRGSGGLTAERECWRTKSMMRGAISRRKREPLKTP